MNASELKERFAALPAIHGKPRLHSWEHYRKILRQHVRDWEPARFLTWPTITCTMFVGEAPYSKAEYDALLALPDFRYIKAGLREVDFGAVRRLSFASQTSGNLVHQMTHLTQWSQSPQAYLPGMKLIVEFGGGYGAMAKICFALGFKGRYILVDLPELLLIQEYYLSNIGITAEYHHDWAGECDMLIACYAFGETPKKRREQFFAGIDARNYLFCHQDTHLDVPDIQQMMLDLTAKKKDVTWQTWRNPHLPGHHYIVGRKA